MIETNDQKFPWPEAPVVFVITRTHNRPKEFKICEEYLLKQKTLPFWVIISDDPADHSYLSDIQLPHKIINVKYQPHRWWIRHNNPFNGYYNSALAEIPERGHVFFLDDDDILIDDSWIETIICKDVDVLIGKFQLGKRHNNQVIGDRIERQHVCNGCYSIRTTVAQQFKWKSRQAADWMFIDAVAKKYPVEYYDNIITKVQTDLNRSWKRRVK